MAVIAAVELGLEVNGLRSGLPGDIGCDAVDVAILKESLVGETDLDARAGKKDASVSTGGASSLKLIDVGECGEVGAVLDGVARTLSGYTAKLKSIAGTAGACTDCSCDGRVLKVPDPDRLKAFVVEAEGEKVLACDDVQVGVGEPFDLRVLDGFEDLAFEGAIGLRVALEEACEVGTGFQQNMGPEWHQKHRINLGDEGGDPSVDIVNVTGAARD